MSLTNASERESDTVKKVDISKYIQTKKNENAINLPLYIVPLVEHKTKVEYNVTMQLLRYMIHIWEDYEKELYDYSNEELLAHRDEISLAMLINKIQCPEDVSSFVSLSGREVEEILKDTPEPLLELLAKLFRALLYNMNMPEDETEDAVARIKERRMAKLFENVTMDIQAERRKAAEAEEKLAAKQEELTIKQKELTLKQEELATAQRELELYKYISKMAINGAAYAEIREAIVQKFSLTGEQAEEEIRKVLED